jgi:hypothetical protein
MTARARKLCAVFGVVLLLGGTAHTFGVSRLYLVKGVPDLNRILLDLWIAEAQLIAGALFLIGSRRSNPSPWIICAALNIWSYALPFLPVLLHRAPPIFWIPPTVYSIASAVAVVKATRE